MHRTVNGLPPPKAEGSTAARGAGARPKRTPAPPVSKTNNHRKQEQQPPPLSGAAAGAVAAATSPPNSPPPAAAGADPAVPNYPNDINGTRAVLSAGSYLPVARRPVVSVVKSIPRRSLPMDAIEEKAEEVTAATAVPITALNSIPNTSRSRIPLPRSQSVPLKRQQPLPSPETNVDFSQAAMESLTHRVLSQRLGLTPYKAEKSRQLGQSVAADLLEKLKKQTRSRRKLVVLVSIGSLIDQQGVQFGSRCLWNKSQDQFVSVKYTNGSLFAVALVYAMEIQ